MRQQIATWGRAQETFVRVREIENSVPGRKRNNKVIGTGVG